MCVWLSEWVIAWMRGAGQHVGEYQAPATPATKAAAAPPPARQAAAAVAATAAAAASAVSSDGTVAQGKRKLEQYLASKIAMNGCILSDADCCLTVVGICVQSRGICSWGGSVETS